MAVKSSLYHFSLYRSKSVSFLGLTHSILWGAHLKLCLPKMRRKVKSRSTSGRFFVDFDMVGVVDL